MLISLNWIKDFVDLPDLPPKELASRFTLATAEVEDVILQGTALKNILCVEIKSLRPHPEADKLNLVTFDIGNGQLKEVVCGAPNVRPGLKVPFAPIGTTLPNGMTLEAKKIRGVLSEGMLCSETELGLGEGKSGLMELDSQVPAGTGFMSYLKMNSDVILDVDNKSLTHRPDLWGYLGLAREFAANFQKPLKNPYDLQWQKNIESRIPGGMNPISIKVEPDSSCLAYYGVSVDNVKLSATPDWMKQRLEAAGLRTINLIVDISNYVMVELGIPNHVFDRKKIAGSALHIRRAGTPLEMTTLDEVKREITAGDTIILDNEKPLVLAGIMGGLESGVDASTDSLFLEVANWEAPEVRKTSVRLGLRTDSSQRYEKTLDSHQCYQTLLRLIQLITDLCPGSRLVGHVEKYVNTEKLARPVKLNISFAEINQSLGMDVPSARVIEIFKNLDFNVNGNSSQIEVTVPTYRTTKDISCKADLIEEIGRMIGYDNITPVSPLLPVKPVRLSRTKIFHRKIQDFLVYQGKALQVMTYPLTGEESLKRALWPTMNEHLRLVNSLSVEQDRMRPSLIPSAIEMAAQNQKHYDAFAFFELGRSYLDFEKERSHLVIGYYSAQATRFLELVNVTEKLFSTLNIPYQFQAPSDKFNNMVLPQGWAGIHPHEHINVQVMGKFYGALVSVHPMVLKNFKMKGHLSLAVIDITDLENKEMKDKTKYAPIAKFPAASFDLTVVIKSDAPAATALQVLQALKHKEIKHRSIVDVYQMNEHQKAVTLRTIFEDPEKTLPPESIKNLEQMVVQALEKAGFPLRS